MTAIISNWGESKGVRIPKSYLNDLGLEKNDILNIEVKNNVVLIKKTPKRRSKTLEERFQKFYGMDFETAISKDPHDCELVDWGQPIGEEVW